MANCSWTRIQTSGCRFTSANVAKRCRSSSPSCFSVEWQVMQWSRNTGKIDSSNESTAAKADMAAFKTNSDANHTIAALKRVTNHLFF